MPIESVDPQQRAPAIDRAPDISGLLVRPIADRVRQAVADGKIRENELDDALSFNARSILDAPDARLDWVPLEDFDSLLAAAAPLFGDEPALAEYAAEIVESWAEESAILSILDASLGLIDAPGFVAAQMSELLTRGSVWEYCGGRAEFSVEFKGLADASVAARVLLGATLARLAECPCESMDDVRFEGVDGEALRIFGRRRDETDAAQTPDDLLEATEAESRLHRAALIF